MMVSKSSPEKADHEFDLWVLFKLLFDGFRVLHMHVCSFRK